MFWVKFIIFGYHAFTSQPGKLANNKHSTTMGKTVERKRLLTGVTDGTIIVFLKTGHLSTHVKE